MGDPRRTGDPIPHGGAKMSDAVDKNIKKIREGVPEFEFTGMGVRMWRVRKRDGKVTDIPE